MKHFAHALIVGGSGMLGGLARHLGDCADRVSVLARNEKRIRAISETVVPIVCDYNDGVALSEALSLLQPPDLVVAWIHGRAPQARRALAQCVGAEGRFVHVLGSAHGAASNPERLGEMAKAAEGLPIDYQAVILGFVVDNGTARWLSNGEISDGVFAAIQSEKPFDVVGVLEPWDARP